MNSRTLPQAEHTRVLLAEEACAVSVVVVSYNTRDVTLRCVQSVLASTGVSIELIVVDNCSSDGSAHAIRERFPAARVIASPTNGGFACGNNLGFSYARGRYLLVLNPDTELAPEAIAKALTLIEADRSCGVLGARVLYPDGRQQSTIFRWLGLRQLTGILLLPNGLMRRTTLFGDQRYARRDRSRPQTVEVVAGCFMLVPRGVIEAVGGFDRRFFMYGEEAEWCRRITRAGWQVRYDPAVEVVHIGGASTGHMPVWKAVEMARGALLFLRLTRGTAIAWLGCLLMVLRDLRSSPWWLLQRLRIRDRSARGGYDAWAGRLGFLLRSLWRLPAGQTVSN